MKMLPVFLLSLLVLSGCQSLQFYHQAVVGQAKLMWQRQSVDTLIESGAADPALRYRLELVAEVLDYARQQGLPSQGSYQSYVETGQEYIVWNVFAARPFELALRTSCFPVAGCVSYRGYFNKEDALIHAGRLKSDGYEVFIGGVTAYSTLGWFDDPLLDTFLFRPEEQLAALLFHELAHQLVYVKNDTRFNESAATAVERFLLRGWLSSRGELARFEAVIARQERQQAVVQLINEARESLRILYATDVPADIMKERKAAILQTLRSDYEVLADAWEEGDEYRRWMQGPINNAKLETVADYNEWVPALMDRLENMGLVRFRDELSRLAALSNEARERELQSATAAIRTSG